jgi:hypothetical protein
MELQDGLDERDWAASSRDVNERQRICVGTTSPSHHRGPARCTLDLQFCDALLRWRTEDVEFAILKPSSRRSSQRSRTGVQRVRYADVQTRGMWT